MMDLGPPILRMLRWIQTNGSSTFALAPLLITNRHAVAEVLKIGNL